MNALEALDPFLSQIARTLFDSSKPAPWLTATMRTRLTPDGSSASQSFELKDPAGRVIAGWFPSDAEMDFMYTLVRDCHRMSLNSKSQQWYGMNLQVQIDGRFATDFEYRDQYTEGDLSREN